jgi:predicted RNase H-like HicB family nuclease
MTIHTIRLELELDEPSGVYTVTSPDVPGLVTEGSTPEEIARNVQEAIECLMDGWIRHSMEIPPALRTRIDTKRPVTVQGLVMV